METPNPYRPSAFADSPPPTDKPPLSRYALKHGVAFFVAYFISTVLLSYLLFGLYQTISSLLSNMNNWLEWLAIGVAVWLGHFTFTLIHPRVRRTGPLINATIGGAAIIFCVFLEMLFSKYGPRSLIMPWYWVPDYVKIAVEFGLSVFITFLACVLVDNYRMQRSGGATVLTEKNRSHLADD